MIALLSVFLPPFILICVRNRIFDTQLSDRKRIMHYLIAVIGLNWVMMMILYFGFDSTGSLSDNLNNHNGFACKYISLAVLIALAEPLTECYIRRHMTLKVARPSGTTFKFCYWKLCAWVYSAVLFALNFIRIFDNCFWGDEGFTIDLAQKSIPGIISGTAADVHPPLYYLLVKIAYEIFGKQGWVFHLVSLIPCVVIIIFSMTTIWKKFGGSASVILITLACLSANAVRNNVEVRMYSWGALFVLLSFYSLYGILEKNRVKDYLLFGLFSLAAAYTHYYCLISVAFFYLVLLVRALVSRKENLKKTLITCVLTVIGYLPWFFIMLRTLTAKTESYWIEEIPTFQESIQELFSGQFPLWLWCLIAVAFIFALLYETRIIKIEKTNKEQYGIRVDISAFHITDRVVFLIAGIISVIGTIGFGITISELIRPFYLVRYIYPVSVVAWVVLCVVISRLKGRKIYSVLLILVMCILFIPSYKKVYLHDKSADKMLTETMELTSDIKTDDVILTDQVHIDWSLAAYYYPGVETELVNLSDVPKLDTGRIYWLILNNIKTAEDTLGQIESQGFECETIAEKGKVGTFTVNIYKLTYEQ